ncbi:molybdopterin molybdotransferase MoeA [Sulfitobacter sp. KE34]|uniref:molybdopterin molybdotransferase MoeA n=1 Tax=unclassified Sulfitobacter TaxID=196795 RepID=UPI0023E20863|nr:MULTISPECIES: gephyrin-like molybdotransferase Glp [unclassified Sulfitobacter]MDF3350694.1 molybdopterin molybdotransferase MoeA [Sulfitobacter sp. KE12]MDF3354103.1 molybdopterin molybdotransferase MoeA [Sulfitobacter sp. KE27]MDF3358014.1 molybdopterin molybdotransferase MoeA [Sulfitobacter sp. KE33]MDF3365175.1 molybdopterin molybdotransferase MoeA [Sulfitobacter sp. Ks34]MDF3368783.1 molybdopterin molybdotransferase MoeA [Sulfitobacter sp. Ks43]
MISVEAALEAVLNLVDPLKTEEVALRGANGRVLSQPVRAQRSQPPFAASSMDGYALCRAEVEPDAMFKVVGEAAAGHAYVGTLRAGQAVRIFTGAPVPEGADFVVIQEDVTRRGDLITLGHHIDDKDNIRPAGGDFTKGENLTAPRILRPADVALLAAMNVAQVPVTRKPIIAILATGDELVQPGESPGPDQIIASNSYGLAAMFEEAGAEVRMLPIARDTTASLKQAFALARGADLIVTIGGASVGDHDLIAPVAAELGMEQSFYKVAMRPGKPLMAGKIGDAAMIGLPGNPVSAMVCGAIFVLPMLRRMLGLTVVHAVKREAPLGREIGPNGPRAHYMRAYLRDGALYPDDRQDSSLLSVLAQADALMIRPPNEPARQAGDLQKYILI